MKVNTKGALFAFLSLSALFLGGCDRLLVLDPKGPQAEVQANDTMLLIQTAMMRNLLEKDREGGKGFHSDHLHLQS